MRRGPTSAFADEQMMRREPPNSGLAKQVAALREIVDVLRADTARQAAKIVALEQRDALPPVTTWVPLKSAVPATLSYETARNWCERGFVKARKEGGRWFVDPQSLRGAAASRMSARG
jgi:hypothetical protein